jgi:tetratricopeptide (TPR) repeat protein
MPAHRTTPPLYALAACALVLLSAPASARRQNQLAQPVVLTLPGMEKAEVRRDVVYKAEGDLKLKLDLYLPPGTPASARLPVVIFVNGVGDPPAGAPVPPLKEWGQYTSWPRLVAASGMAAVTYQSRGEEADADSDDLLDYVRRNAAALRVDENRLSLWSCSANVRVGLSATMQPGRNYIRSAVFYYGLMSLPAVRPEVPIFVARAGYDNPQLNQTLDAYVRRALDAEAQVTLVNYADGQHAFDVRDDTERSREIVRQTLDFIKFHFTPGGEVKSLAARPPSPVKFQSMIASEGIQKALQAYEEARKSNPSASIFQEQYLNALGYQLLQEQKPKDAIEIFKLNVAAYPQSPNVYDSLADAYAADGQNDLAVQLSEKALEVLAKANLNEQQATPIRNSANDKIKRLRKP